MWGIGIKAEENPEEVKTQKARKLFTSDSQLIDQLSPYLSQNTLAKLLIVKKYRDVSPEELQLLIGGAYRLLGDILGPRRHYYREVQTPKFLPLPDLPAELFSDNLVTRVLYESEREILAELETT